MCDICRARDDRDSETLKIIRNNYERAASQLEHLAVRYRALGRLQLDPHGDDSRTMRLDAHQAIRRLVEDWL